DRDIVPHSIADSGLRWHVRAFDRKRGEFRDFVINRIKTIFVLSKQEIPKPQIASNDKEWNDFVELEIQPHPKLGDARTMLNFEYRMLNGVLNINVRKALAGYLLDTWNVDTTIDGSLAGSHFM